MVYEMLYSDEVGQQYTPDELQFLADIFIEKVLPTLKDIPTDGKTFKTIRFRNDDMVIGTCYTPEGRLLVAFTFEGHPPVMDGWHRVKM